MEKFPQSPAADTPSKTPEPHQRNEEPASQAHGKAAGAKGGGGADAVGGSGRAGGVAGPGTKGKGTGLSRQAAVVKVVRELVKSGSGVRKALNNQDHC